MGNAAIGRMIASVPESQTMGVYDAVSALVPAEVPKYLMSTVKEADAKKAYEAFLTFKDVVKANPITPKVVDTPAALASKLAPIDAAAKKLSDASYPFIKSAPWDSDLYLKPLPGVSPNAAMKAIDKMIHGCKHGRQAAEGGGNGPPQRPQQHGQQTRDLGRKLPSSKCGTRQGNRIRPKQPGHGCLHAFAKITSSSVPNMLFS